MSKTTSNPHKHWASSTPPRIFETLKSTLKITSIHRTFSEGGELSY